MKSGQEFANQVHLLKRDLRAMMNKRLDEFREETGVAPGSIDVQMFDTTIVSDPIKSYRVGDVELEFNF